LAEIKQGTLLNSDFAALYDHAQLQTGQRGIAAA
jgi:hypothetical protein